MSYLMQSTKALLPAVLAAAAVLSGCATREPLPELVSARQEVAATTQDADAVAAGALRLDEARKSLNAAETAYQEREDDAVVRELAVAASRNAQIAREQGAESRSKAAIEKGEAERNRVLLDARTQEAEQARAAANTNARVAADAQDEAARMKAEAARMKELMAELQAKETERGMVVTLGDVLFDTNQAVVRPEARANLERIGAFLAGNTGFRAIVEGHTDSRGSDEYNRSLSQRRADAVMAVLTRGGVSSDRVRATGLGEAYPVASNETSSGQQQNRRVEVVFSDEKGAFAPGGERM